MSYTNILSDQVKVKPGKHCACEQTFSIKETKLKEIKFDEK